MPDLAWVTRIFRSEQLRSSIFTLLYSRRKSCNDLAWVTNCPWEETSFPSFQNLTSSLKLNEAKMVSKQTSKRLESVLEVGPISKLSIFPALVVKSAGDTCSQTSQCWDQGIPCLDVWTAYISSSTWMHEAPGFRFSLHFLSGFSGILCTCLQESGDHRQSPSALPHTLWQSIPWCGSSGWYQSCLQ